MKRTRTWMLAVVAGWIGASLGAAPATPSYVGVEATIGKIQSEWAKPGAAAMPNAPGWNALFDLIRKDLGDYASAKTEDDRLRALGGLYRVSLALDTVSWPPAEKIREELRTWLRPRVSLAWAEKQLIDTVRGLPATSDPSARKNRDQWVHFVGDDLGTALRAYEGATQVRQRREALGKVLGAIVALQEKNHGAAWGPSLTLQAAVDDLYNTPNLHATADVDSVSAKLQNNLVESGPVYRKGQTSYVTAGPFLGFGLLPSDDGIAFYNRQALSSVTPVNGFQEQIASDPKGKRAAKLYQFGMTTYDQSILTVVAVLRTTGLELFPDSTHATDASVGSAPQPGKGLGRAFAAVLGFNQRKINRKVYEGAIGQVRSSVDEEAREEAQEKSGVRAAETNAQLSQFLPGGNRLTVNNFEVDELRLRSRPEFVIVDGNFQWKGAKEQLGADMPKPARFDQPGVGVSADVHLSSIMTNLTRGYLQGDQARTTTNLMIVTQKIPPGTKASEGFIASQNVDFPTFLRAVDAAQAANDPKVLALRVKRPGRSPEFSGDRNGFLVATVHDFQIEVPAPESARKGGLAGPPARVYRMEAPEAEFTISFQVAPAKDNLPIKLSGRIEGFDPGPNAKVYAINDDDTKAVALSPFTSTVVFGVFGSKLKEQPIDVPLGDLKIPGFTLSSVSNLDPTGWMRVTLTPSGPQSPAPATSPSVATLPAAIAN